MKMNCNGHLRIGKKVDLFLAVLVPIIIKYIMISKDIYHRQVCSKRPLHSSTPFSLKSSNLCWQRRAP